MNSIKSSELHWLVMYHDVNADKIKYYDVLKHRNDDIKKLKKECKNKDEFSLRIRREFMWRYWSKCEWELIIEIDDNNRILLTPWCGCREPEAVRIDVTDRDDFDWRGFAEDHILNKGYRHNRAKIDVFDQLEYRWEEFVDYCWYTRLKYERDNPKFHR